MLSQRFVRLFLHSAGGVVSLEGAARRLMHEGRPSDEGGLKTKIRRLYDIANILCSLGLIEKTTVPDGSRKPAFRWVADGAAAAATSPAGRPGDPDASSQETVDGGGGGQPASRRRPAGACEAAAGPGANEPRKRARAPAPGPGAPAPGAGAAAEASPPFTAACLGPGTVSPRQLDQGFASPPAGGPAASGGPAPAVETVSDSAGGGGGRMILSM